MPPGLRYLGSSPWRPSAVRLVWTPLASPEARTPEPGRVLSRGRAQRTIPRVHWAVAGALAASGGSHPLSFLTQGTAWGRLRPRDQHPRATCTQKAAAAVAHTHLFPHSPLLPSASDHPCSPACIYQPILTATQGVAASSTPGPWPQRGASHTACSTLPPCTFAGIKMVMVWGPLVASRSP